MDENKTVEKKLSAKQCTICLGIGHNRQICPTFTKDEREKKARLDYSKLTRNDVKVSLHINKTVKNTMTDLVNRGIFFSQSELMRVALATYLDDRGYL